MNKFILFFIIITLIVSASCFIFFKRPKQEVNLEAKLKGNMILTSSVFQNNSSIPQKYTCDGDNINPLLEIQGVPQEAKSLVLIIDDPDASLDTWVHWLVWNIDPKTTQIQENSIPANAKEGKTSFGKSGYGGPCPPSGTHHYFFKLYALDIILDFPSETDKMALEKVIEGYVLEKAELVGLYSHK